MTVSNSEIQVDPFTSIGLASSIVQFVEFSTKLITGAQDIHGSATSMTRENKNLESIVTEMKGLSSKLLRSTGPLKSEDDKALGASQKSVTFWQVGLHKSFGGTIQTVLQYGADPAWKFSSLDEKISC